LLDATDDSAFPKARSRSHKSARVPPPPTSAFLSKHINTRRAGSAEENQKNIVTPPNLPRDQH
jgi:hypothetical protein